MVRDKLAGIISKGSAGPVSPSSDALPEHDIKSGRIKTTFIRISLKKLNVQYLCIDIGFYLELLN
jgi:hypothetical protein